MSTFNKVTLLAYLTKEPELSYTPKGIAVCKFSVAMFYESKNMPADSKSEATFVDIVVWNKPAESCTTFLQKKSHVFIEGRLKLNQWIDKEQKKHSKLVVVANRIIFLSGCKTVATNTASVASPAPVESVPEIPDEDIPF